MALAKLLHTTKKLQAKSSEKVLQHKMRQRGRTTMRIEVTSKVVSHHTNPDYNCLLVQFEPGDKHYHQFRKNWMPKDQEVFNIWKIMINLSPTLRNKCFAYIREHYGETMIPKQIQTKLAEVTL
jgi:hypothetical protein